MTEPKVTITISGPQGSGKSKIKRQLERLLVREPYQQESVALTDLATIIEQQTDGRDNVVGVVTEPAPTVAFTLQRLDAPSNAGQKIDDNFARIETAIVDLQSWRASVEALSIAKAVREGYDAISKFGAGWPASTAAWPTPTAVTETPPCQSFADTPNAHPEAIEDAAPAARFVYLTGINSLWINAMRDEIHAANVAAGWWNDLGTGVSTLPREMTGVVRNAGELLMLCVSELAEAADGLDGGLMDDKLPHRPMIEVELADSAIRIFDLAGGFELDIGGAAEELIDLGVQKDRTVTNTYDRLMQIVQEFARAMEGHRKGAHDTDLPHRPMFEVRLATALLRIIRLAHDCDLDLMGAISEKRGYNAQRPDHKRENRAAAGGKKY